EGLDLGLQLRFEDFGMHLELCHRPSSKCWTAVDFRNFNGVFNDHFGAPPPEFSLVRLPGDAISFASPERLAPDPFILDVDWDAFMFNVASALGLPSNRGHIEGSVPLGPAGNMIIAMDYIVLQTY